MTMHLESKRNKSEARCGLTFTHGLDTTLTRDVSKITCADCKRLLLNGPEQASGASTAVKVLGEILGINPDRITVIDASKDFNPTVIGSRPFEVFALEKMHHSDVPEHMQRMLEVPAFVAGTLEHFPTFAAVVLSAASFYYEQLRRAVICGSVSEEQATQRLDDARALVQHCGKSRTDGDCQSEWPLTVDLWQAEEEGED